MRTTSEPTVVSTGVLLRVMVTCLSILIGWDNETTCWGLRQARRDSGRAKTVEPWARYPDGYRFAERYASLSFVTPPCRTMKPCVEDGAPGGFLSGRRGWWCRWRGWGAGARRRRGRDGRG
jgi:hypothetical protein